VRLCRAAAASWVAGAWRHHPEGALIQLNSSSGESVEFLDIDFDVEFS
jgi:hypothetical protein